MKQLAGKIAVVTGASRGIGQRIALRLGREGAAVALIARSEAGLRETEQELHSLGVRALVEPADLSRPESVDRAKETIEFELGIPSILVNAAGVFGPIDLVKDGDPAAWIETIMVNAIAPYLTCRAFVGGMIAHGWGRIVNVTSAAALHEPGPINSAYGTSKAALNQFTRHLATELKGTGVTANVIHPGDVKTDMWAIIKEEAGRLGSIAHAHVQWADWVEKTGGDNPEKAADLVVGLMSNEAAGVNGRFLWIKDGLQAPIASWGERDERQAWRK
ncbi:MAG TPA: SDR family oxidoreductase [Terracidiphilus sp.]|jgi:NAD(P)-dependent dehydrogenase (short-subunit alcohol dehydrogenase family)|nr:SDR family oxidoreductase [Terracidiphilus sp.]